MSQTQKINAAIIGPGNIGTDLLMKALRSESINPVWMVGIEESAGIIRAREFGLKTTTDGVQGLVPHMKDDEVGIVFDATSAYIHEANSKLVVAAGATMIDLTPAAIGPYCIPPVNLQELLQHGGVNNINMVTCGGQATIPIVAAISQVQTVEYAEIIATISSLSAGPGTRKNIDEFTLTTARAIEKVGKAAKGKAIIILNPAEPPLMMRDTVHCLTEDEPNREAIISSIKSMISSVQTYVPGYRMNADVVFDGKRVSVFLEVEGLGDFLPAYSGNLDIMTAAALRTAEMLVNWESTS